MPLPNGLLIMDGVSQSRCRVAIRRQNLQFCCAPRTSRRASIGNRPSFAETGQWLRSPAARL